MGALTGLKILDFSTLMPGPIATTFLADHGADVVSVVAPNKRDQMNDIPPFLDDLGISASFAWLGRNKRTISLNLKKKAAVDAVRKLIHEYDIIVEQFRPGTMKSLGLDYETLKKENPSIIYCSLTGYGQTGPLAMRPGHDINYLALSGNMLILDQDYKGAPVLPNFQLADVGGGSYMTIMGILVAAYCREKTGKGQYIDISMLDSILPFGCVEASGVLASEKYSSGWTERTQSGAYLGPFYGCYRTSDGKYISIGAIEPKFFAGLCQGLGLGEWADGRILRKDPELFRRTVAEKFLTKTRQEWTEIFQNIDTCVEPVLTIREMCDHKQILARDMVPEVPVALKEGETIKQIGNPLKLSETPAEYRHTAYPPGYHTGEILSQFGYGDMEIQDMSRA